MSELTLQEKLTLALVDVSGDVTPVMREAGVTFAGMLRQSAPEARDVTIGRILIAVCQLAGTAGRQTGYDADRVLDIVAGTLSGAALELTRAERDA